MGAQTLLTFLAQYGIRPIVASSTCQPSDQAGPVRQPQSPGVADAEVVFWQTIANSTSPAEYEAYLQQYPSGRFAALARVRIQALTPQAPARPPSHAVQPGEFVTLEEARRQPPPGADLDIVDTRPTWSRNVADGRPTLVIEGRVKNMSNTARDIPQLRAVLRNGTVDVQSWTFTASAPRVPPGGEVPFRTEARDPPAATTVVIVFALAE